jgi:hypothetical protein
VLDVLDLTPFVGLAVLAVLAAGVTFARRRRRRREDAADVEMAQRGSTRLSGPRDWAPPPLPDRSRAAPRYGPASRRPKSR